MLLVMVLPESLRKKIGLSEALIGFHALTCCDFNSELYRKDKSTPFGYLEKDKNHVDALRSLCSDGIDKAAVTTYAWRVYGFKTQSITSMRPGISLSSKRHMVNKKT